MLAACIGVVFGKRSATTVFRDVDCDYDHYLRLERDSVAQRHIAAKKRTGC